jgi:hypothetical protein
MPVTPTASAFMASHRAHPRRGYLEKETVLMDAELLPSKTQLGVLTGRTRT